MKTYIKKVEEHLDWAWAILANAGGGDWTRESKDWQGAVKKWRDDYYKILDEQKEHKTDGTKCWCNPQIIKVGQQPTCKNERCFNLR